MVSDHIVELNNAIDQYLKEHYLEALPALGFKYRDTHGLPWWVIERVFVESFSAYMSKAKPILLQYLEDQYNVRKSIG